MGSVKGMVRDQVKAAGLKRYVGAPSDGWQRTVRLAGCRPASVSTVPYNITGRVHGLLPPSDVARRDDRLLIAGNRVIVVDDETHDKAAAMTPTCRM